MVLWIVAAAAHPWEFGWEALVAIGTLALAVGTAWLAFQTRNLAAKTAEEVEHSRRQVDASLEQAATAQLALAAARVQTRLAQLTLNAQVRPVLIDMALPVEEYVSHEQILYPDGHRSHAESHAVEVRFDVNFGDAMISVPMRNAGAGLAMIRGVSLEVSEPTPPPPVTIQPANVPAGENTRINSWLPQTIPPFRPLSGLSNVRASRSSSRTRISPAQQLTQAHFSLHRDGGTNLRGWGVRQVHLQEPDADAPFAGSAPAA